MGHFGHISGSCRRADGYPKAEDETTADEATEVVACGLDDCSDNDD